MLWITQINHKKMLSAIGVVLGNPGHHACKGGKNDLPYACSNPHIKATRICAVEFIIVAGATL